MASGCNAQSRVLDGLELFNRGWTGIRDPDGSRVGERGVDDGFIRGDQGFFMLAPVCTCESLKDGESLFGALSQTFRMFVEEEQRVKSDAKNLGNCSKGSGVPLSGTTGWEPYCLLSEVKRVTVDFCAEICSSLSAAQVATSCAWRTNTAVASPTSGCEAEAVKSSAYDVTRSAVCG